MPFDPEPLTEETFTDLREWAKKLWDETPKCERCGEVLGKEKWARESEPDEFKFCSSNCAENAEADALAEESKAIQDAYPRAECPDCGEDIPDNVREGEECENCGHVFWSDN